MVPVGPKLETHDNQGDVFTTLVTDSGYRLICDKIPPQFSVEVVFALASVLPQFDRPLNPDKNKWAMEIEELGNVSTIFDMLDQRPFPTHISVDGSYTMRFKPMAIHRTEAVLDGN